MSEAQFILSEAQFISFCLGWLSGLVVLVLVVRWWCNK